LQPDVRLVTSTDDIGSASGYSLVMRSAFTAVVERDAATGLLVGHVPGMPGTHTQAATLDELSRNLREVIEMLLEDGDPLVEGEFFGTQPITAGETSRGRCFGRSHATLK
jgi:predicted RNase H-like HicB family nuclease